MQGSSYDEEGYDDMRNYMKDHGTGMLKELIGRMNNTMNEAEEYVPQGILVQIFLRVRLFHVCDITSLLFWSVTGYEVDLSQSSL